MTRTVGRVVEEAHVEIGQFEAVILEPVERLVEPYPLVGGGTADGDRQCAADRHGSRGLDRWAGVRPGGLGAATEHQAGDGERSQRNESGECCGELRHATTFRSADCRRSAW